MRDNFMKTNKKTVKKAAKDPEPAGVRFDPEMPIGSVRAWSKQPRKKFDKPAHKEMMASIESVGGIQQPIMVRPDPENEGGYLIVAGERRWRGAKGLSHETVPVMINAGLSERDAYEVALIENIHRSDLTCYEEARGYASLRSYGYSLREVAKKVGKSFAGVVSYLKLVDLNEKEREELEAGRLAIAVAGELVELPDATEDDQARRARALEEVMLPAFQSGPMSRDKAVKHIRQRFIEPMKAAAVWHGRKESLLEEYPGAEILSYEESEIGGSWNTPYAEVGAQPAYGDGINARVQGLAGKDRPTWGELGAKYGARLVLCCPADGGEETPPRVMLAMEPIREADIAQASVEDSVFVKPANGDSAKEEALAAEKARMEASALSSRVKAQKRLLALELLSGAINEVAPLYFEEWVKDDGLDDLPQIYMLIFPEKGEVTDDEVFDWARKKLASLGPVFIAWVDLVKGLDGYLCPDLTEWVKETGLEKECPDLIRDKKESAESEG